MAQHALVTGPITGRIPHGDGFIDVTPDVVYLGSEEEARAVADSVEVEHAVRGTHPLQAECASLSPLAERLEQVELPKGIDRSTALAIAGHLIGDPDLGARVEAHRAAHKALNKKAGL